MNETTIPYEFHVTVEAANINVEDFIQVCQDLGAKAIVLDLGINNGTELSDVMTSSKGAFPSDGDAFDELNRIADGLSSEDFIVIRRKIETAPWHPFAPQSSEDEMPAGSYFESHLAIQCEPESIPALRQGIAESAEELPLHLSRNAFKKAEDGKVIIMSTLRDYQSGYADFSQQVDASVERIEDLGFDLAKTPITEFALYDSNIHQDDDWMRR